jgi:hypothetical protein
VVISPKYEDSGWQALSSNLNTTKKKITEYEDYMSMLKYNKITGVEEKFKGKKRGK